MNMRPILQGWLLVYLTILLIALISSRAEAKEWNVTKTQLREIKADAMFDKDVARFVAKFSKDYKRDIRYSVRVYPLIVPDEPQVVGICLPSYMQVRLKRSRWIRYNDVQKEILVYHELLHCEFGLEHYGVEEDLKKACPSSIMHPITLPVACYKVFRRLYIRQSKWMIRLKRLKRAIRKHAF